MIKTLRRQFIAIAMCSITLVLAAIITGINVANYLNVCRNADQRIDLISANDGTFPSAPGMNPALPDDGETAPELPEEERPDSAKDGFGLRRHALSAEAAFDTRYFTVILSDDGTLLSVNTGKIAEVSTSDAADYAVSLWSKHKEKGFLDNYRYRAFSAASDSGDSAVMYIFLYSERELDTFRTFLLASVSISLAGLLVVFLLVLFLSKKVLHPVAESYEKQKRFITDASHEIKTPLAIIDANTEVMEMENGETQWTKSTKNQVARLSALTEKLVFLSRMDEEDAKLDLQLFDLSEAVLDAAEPFLALAESRDKALKLDVTPEIKIKGDEAALRQLVSLLLDNAVKYSSEKGTIHLSLSANGRARSAALTVRNATEPMEPGRHDELFERFYRPDSSRSLKTGGFGIGLSVAKAIANAHRGKITAKSEDGSSLTFTVTLPLS